MFYLDESGWRQNYRNNIEAKGTVLYIISCKKILGGPVQFGFFRRCDNRLGRCETIISPGFHFDKNDSSIGSNHNQINLAGPAGEVAGQFFEAFSFQKPFAAFFPPSAKLLSISQQPAFVQQQISYLVSRISLFGHGVLAVSMSQAGRLAGSLAEIIQFCTPCFAASNRPNINHIRRMNWENSLHAFVVYDSPHREGFINPTTSAGNYCAGKHLNTLFVAFPDSAAHIYRVAYFKMRYILFEAFTFDSIQHFSFH